MPNNDAIQPVGGLKTREGFESQRSKILEMAQGVMAEKFGQAQGGNQNGAAPVDVTKFSNEAVDELANKNGNVDTSRSDTIISALREIADKKVGEQEEKGQSGGAGSKKKGGKGKVKVEWKPQTEKGKLHKGRDVIGRIKLTQTPPQGGDQTETVNGVGKSKNGNSAAGGSSSAAKTGSASASQGAGAANTQTGNEKTNPQQSDKEQDKVELSPESAAMAAKLQNSGAQMPAEVKAASEGKGIASPQKAGGGGGGGEVSMEKEVRTRAFGKTQTAEVTPEGELPPGAPLRTFQKLDDMPMLDNVTLHDVKGKDAVKQLQEKAKRGEINPQEITPEMIEKLKNPQAMQ